ncbi:MAG: BTAD domain-containing putative transcriptional regulator [Oscillospiraceae bacterium]
MKNKQILEIHMFGDFSLALGDNRVSSTDSPSHKLWLLMQYLILRRGHFVPQNELIDILWPNAEISNPPNSLKALVFRLRKQLDLLGCSGGDVILQEDGGYAFNCKYPYYLDIEYFELKYRLANAAGLPQKKLKLLMQAFEVFDGSVLAKNQNEPWAQESFTRYNMLFRRIVQDIVELQNQRGDFSGVVSLCQRAISVQTYEELFHVYLVNAFVSMENFSEASRRYSLSRDIFHTPLTNSPSLKFSPIYDESYTGAAPTDTLLEMRNIISEKYNFGYSYYCVFEVFCSMYHMLARRLYRHPADAFLALFYIENQSLPADDPTRIQTDSAHIRMLGEAIAFSLRQSDIFSLYDTSRFLVIFEAVTAGQLSSISGRIKKYFDKNKAEDKFAIHFEALPILPSMPLTGTPDNAP